MRAAPGHSEATNHPTATLTSPLSSGSPSATRGPTGSSPLFATRPFHALHAGSSSSSTRGQSAASATTDPGFELNLNTGGRLTSRADREPQPGERHWFAVDRSVLAAHGIALLGPSAAEVFAPIAADDLRPVLADVLRWYEREAPESDDAILNAGRSLRFVREGVWLPKPALRAWAAGQPGTNEEILACTIAELEAD